MKKNKIIFLIYLIFIVFGIFINNIVVRNSKKVDNNSSSIGTDKKFNNIEDCAKITSLKNDKINEHGNVLINDKSTLNNIESNKKFRVEKNNYKFNVANYKIKNTIVDREKTEYINNEKSDIVDNIVVDLKKDFSIQNQVNVEKNTVNLANIVNTNKQDDLNNVNLNHNVLPRQSMQIDKNNELVSKLKNEENSKSILGPLDKTNGEELKSKVNIEAGKSVKTSYEDDERKITTLWVRGVNPVKFNNFNKERFNDYLIVTTGYKFNSGWYDVNKNANGISDRVLCSGVVASNMLHWWLEQNKNYIDRYLRENPSRAVLPGENSVWKNLNYYISSYNNKHDSKIFEMFKLYYGNTNGIWADTSVDFFINGYNPSLSGATNRPERFVRDNRGGFFYEVFGKNTLTKRFFSGNYDDFSDSIKVELQSGNIMGISHRTPSKRANHIITLWGADFDENGKIIGIYVSDSDDYNEPEVGMRRLNVNNKNGKPVITSSIKKNIGINLEYVHSLSLGTDEWERFFK